MHLYVIYLYYLHFWLDRRTINWKGVLNLICYFRARPKGLCHLGMTVLPWRPGERQFPTKRVSVGDDQSPDDTLSLVRHNTIPFIDCKVFALLILYDAAMNPFVQLMHPFLQQSFLQFMYPLFRSLCLLVQFLNKFIRTFVATTTFTHSVVTLLHTYTCFVLTIKIRFSVFVKLNLSNG